jgi:hypothetical protein
MQCLTVYGSPDGPYAGALSSMTLFAGVLTSDGPFEGDRTIHMTNPPPR